MNPEGDPTDPDSEDDEDDDDDEVCPKPQDVMRMRKENLPEK